MSHTSGPVSSLPGAAFSPEEGYMCDDHPDRQAVIRVQGETDSFGAEYFYMCEECNAKYKAEKAALNGGAFIGNCDRCGTRDVPMFAWRDYDEGLSGPVYYNCRKCKTEIVTSMNEAAAEELADRGYDDYFDDDGE